MSRTKPIPEDRRAQRRLSPRRSIFGDVMHARLKPFGHRFSYRVMSLLIDLDRLDEADRMSTLFGVNRAALYSFHEKDHGQRDGSSLRAFAQRAAAAHGIDLAGGTDHAALLSAAARLRLQSARRSTSVTTPAATSSLIIYEVRNTLRRDASLRPAGCR